MKSRFKAFYTKVRQSKFAQDSFWALFGNVLAKAMSLLGAIIVARLLGKEIFGEFGTIRSTLISVAMFSTFGLGYTATKFIAESKDRNPNLIKGIAILTMGISLVLSGILAILLFVFAKYVSDVIFEAPHLVTPVRLVSFWVIFSALTTAQIGILSGFNAFKSMARINTYVGILAFTNSFILTYFFDLNGALIALLCTQIFNCYLNYMEVQKFIPAANLVGSAEFKALSKKILKFSTPVAMQEGLYALTSWLTIILLLKFSDYGEVGLYSAAAQWSAIILFIPGILRNVILTHLSENNKDLLKHTEIIRKTILINLVTTVIPFIGIYLLRHWIVGFYGESYKDELDYILAISLFSTIFISISNVYAQAFMSIDKNWYMFGLRFTRDVLIITGTYLFLINNIYSGALSLVVSNLIIQICFLVIIMFIYNNIKLGHV
ncbi:oligosaccharide flippase family protein [Maribacter chungangensis]|uniref:Oligosaccharide flippase family protein n=1 Tax=Maribacter chungangensis TaxID=1069117 RepID=A0ABW3B567_9FLAO